jgi:hypothetical protein
MSAMEKSDLPEPKNRGSLKQPPSQWHSRAGGRAHSGVEKIEAVTSETLRVQRRDIPIFGLNLRTGKVLRSS